MKHPARLLSSRIDAGSCQQAVLSIDARSSRQEPTREATPALHRILDPLDQGILPVEPRAGSLRRAARGGLSAGEPRCPATSGARGPEALAPFVACGQQVLRLVRVITDDVSPTPPSDSHDDEKLTDSDESENPACDMPFGASKSQRHACYEGS